MKKVLLLFFSLSPFFFCRMAGFSQHVNAGQNDFKKNTSTSVATSPAIAELRHSLENALTKKKKADILYEMANSFLGSFKIDSSIHYLQALRKIALDDNYTAGIGKYHLASAGVYFLRNNGKEVSNHLDTAIRFFQLEQSDLYLGQSYRLKGRLLGQNNNNTGAQEYYRMAVAFIRRSGDQNYLQRTLHDFGRNFFFSFEVDSAALYLTQALKIAEQMKSRPRTFNCASTLGAVYLLANNMQEAVKTLKYALDICPPDADKVQLRAVWANLTEAFILTDHYADAEKTLNEHDKINAALGDITGQLNHKKLNGFLLYRKGENKKALQYLREAYGLKQQLGNTDFDIMAIALYLGQCELKEGLIDEALLHFHHAKQLSASYNFIAAAVDANNLLAKAHEQKNNTDSAYHYFRIYTFINDSILKNKRDRTILELSARYNAEKTGYQIKELQKENELFSFQLLLKNKTIQAQHLLDQQQSQRLELITQQSEVNRLRASEQSLALQNRNKEFLQKQKELELAQKENKLQQALASKESQNKKLLLIIIIAGILAGCYGVYRYRQKERMSRKLAESLTGLKQAQQQLILAEKQNEAQSIRQSISRDIHDEVGATLSGVVLFSEIAREIIDKGSRGDASQYLDHIYSNSKDMLEKMSDIVWAINPKNDSFERIIFKLRSYAMNLCAGKGIELHFTIEEALFRFSISMQTRRNIYLLAKEALNNAIKYSGADTIYFSAKRQNLFLQIEVRDNGQGFILTEKLVGDGIGNMQARARELGSDLVIESSPGKGTSISLAFEFHPMEVQNVPAV